MLLEHVFRGQQYPGRTVRDLRTVAGGDIADRPVEHRAQPGEFLHAGIRAHAVVVPVDLAAGIVERFDLVEMSAFLCGGEALVTERVRAGSGVIEGVTFGVERSAELKGFDDPIALIPVFRFG